MYYVTINGKKYEIVPDSGGTSGTLNGKPFTLDVLRTGDKSCHMLFENRSYNLEFSQGAEPNHYRLKVNGKELNAELLDRFDMLLASMGMGQGSGSKMQHLKAPMPGMVLDVLVSEGTVVEKDTPLVILEAMKMENVIKSPMQGSVSRVLAKKGFAVEKNSVLIEFA